MKRECKTCKWQKSSSINTGKAYQDRCVNSKMIEAYAGFYNLFNDFGCSEWTPKKRGTCCECEYWARGITTNNIQTGNCHFNTITITKIKDSVCRKWMPKEDE